MVAMAVTASTLTTVAVFFPLVFVQGLAGQLIRDQALTISFSLLASLVVAFTLVPTLTVVGARGRSTHEVPGGAAGAGAAAGGPAPQASRPRGPARRRACSAGSSSCRGW